jgi:hypothetical protein
MIGRCLQPSPLLSSFDLPFEHDNVADDEIELDLRVTCGVAVESLLVWQSTKLFTMFSSSSRWSREPFGMHHQQGHLWTVEMAMQAHHQYFNQGLPRSGTPPNLAARMKRGMSREVFPAESTGIDRSQACQRNDQYQTLAK